MGSAVDAHASGFRTDGTWWLMLFRDENTRHLPCTELALADDDLMPAWRQAVMRIFCAIAYLEAINPYLPVDGVGTMSDTSEFDVHSVY